ncbi:MAG TPA: ABC transporter [Deltaproteobacteria bacterium]|nr:MAG: hypothetical protein A2048_08415 [Deltaproteobacteria bacterium GWA2_45_12]HBF11987.1 ABC transporter [Deltaproteobacteria bacterium]
MLELKSVSFSIKNKQILSDIDFKIEKGDFVGLVGPNGSGKTTLLKILSGVLSHYQGSVNLDLVPIKALKPKALAQFVAMVPQENNLPYPFTALEIVMMGRFPYKKMFDFDSTEDFQVARRAMEKTDCWALAHRNIDTLSGGEKQRLFLARALAQKTKILLLDEPANHLDLKHQKEFFALLTQLSRDEKLTIICVVHDLNLASLHCQKMAFLKEGRLLSFGPTSQILNPKTIKGVFDVGCQELKTPEGHSQFVFV